MGETTDGTSDRTLGQVSTYYGALYVTKDMSGEFLLSLALYGDQPDEIPVSREFAEAWAREFQPTPALEGWDAA